MALLDCANKTTVWNGFECYDNGKVLSKMKIGVMQYVAMKRVGLAETLLSKNMRPTEVATTVGFEDYSNFYRTYKKYKGKSPTGK